MCPVWLRAGTATSNTAAVANRHRCVLYPPIVPQMGLGKTAQSISVLAYQRQFGHVNGPFLGRCSTADSCTQ